MRGNSIGSMGPERSLVGRTGRDVCIVVAFVSRRFIIAHKLIGRLECSG